MEKRQELQMKLQEITRRSGSAGELNKIQMEIEALNRKISAELRLNQSDG